MPKVRRPREWSERPRTPAMLDVMAALAVTVIVTASTALLVDIAADENVRAVGPWGYALVVLGGLVLVWRTSAPVLTFTVTLVLGLLYQGGRYPGGPDPLPVIVAIYTIAARGDRQRALGLGLLASVLLVGVRGLFVTNGLESPLLVAFPTATFAALYAGQLVANHQARQVAAAQAAIEAERLRELDTHRRVEAERLRIARELHDVVAHNISLINVQATMGVHVMPGQPEQATAALVAIKQASRQALRELRRILDVLRQADEDEPTGPAPGLGQLEAMVISTGQAGLPTRLSIQGTPRPISDTVDVAAYRIIQESLTNALRYAAPAPTEVTLRYRTESLTILITDEGRVKAPGPQSGHGIAGMRERAAAVGGTLEAGPAPSGGFTVRAELPIGTARS